MLPEISKWECCCVGIECAPSVLGLYGIAAFAFENIASTHSRHTGRMFALIYDTLNQDTRARTPGVANAPPVRCLILGLVPFQRGRLAVLS